MSAIQNISSDERAIATRICYGYQSKDSNFRAQTYYGGTFVFNIVNKDCKSVTVNYNIPGILTLEDKVNMTYETESVKAFESKIQTNQSGYLVQVCKKIQSNKTISNTATESGTQVQVRFFKDVASGLDSYKLSYFTAAGVITKAETFNVRTQFNVSGKQILGMDEKFIRQESCPGSDKYSEFSQAFSNFTSK